MASTGSVRIILVNRFFYPDYSATSELLSDLAFALCRRGFRVAVISSRLC
jgi:colanic acid biosynthesis glycosyl transferase WcaI